MSSSSSNPRSILELMKVEVERFEKMKKEMEKVGNERDLWKREAEELRFYKTRVRELEDWMLKATTLGSNSPPIPSSTKRKRKCNEYSGKEEEEEIRTHNSESEKDNIDPPKTHSIKSGRKKWDACIKIRRINNSAKSRPQISGVTYKFTSIINNIKNNLSKENLEKFENSCFGHLLEIDKLQFQGNVLLHLLMHMDANSSNTEKIVFNINNTSIQFGPRDFSLITGLRLGTSEEAMTTTTSASSIENKFFKGKSLILSKNIEELFLKVSCVGGGEDIDEMTILQLALLYCLYGIVLAGNHSKKINPCYFDLIDDLEKFMAFPWGRVAYEFLTSAMLSARSSMYNTRSEVTQTGPSVNIYGFSFALQVWAYEVMPSLAEYCAVHRVNNPKRPTPRILHWSTLKKKICFNTLEKFFTPGDDHEEAEPHLELHGIRATQWELKALRGGNITPQPQKKKSVTNASKPTSSAKSPTNTHQPARVSTHQSNANVAKAERQKKPLMGKCSCFVAGDVICLSSDDEAAAVSGSRFQDSDDESLTDSMLDELVAEIKRENGGE